MLRVAAQARVEEFRDRMRAAALVAYHVYLATPLAEGHRHVSLREFLEQYGLGFDEAEPREPEDVEAIKRRALETARRIAELDKRRKQS